MRLMEKLYRSSTGRLMSRAARLAFSLNKPRMIYGYDDAATGSFRKYTRMSNTVVIMSPEKLAAGDHVWVWHHTILDATEGLNLGEGTQIGAWVGIFTHGSETAIRLLGRRFVDVPNTERQGYTRGSVSIGAYSFIGAGSIILPGVSIGKGCLVAAMSLVTKDVPDYAIVRGQPAKIAGDTRELDAGHFIEHDFSDSYYDPDALKYIREKIRNPEAG